MPGARRMLRSAVDTGLEDAAADWTVCIDVAHHRDDRELPGFARVTRDRLVFVDPLRPRRDASLAAA